MKIKNSKSGFTLLEIIIVIIIVGVLTSLALPRLFNAIEFSRSTEALNAIGFIRRSADRCAMAVESYTGVANHYRRCDRFGKLEMNNPQGASGASFNYSILDFSSPNYTVIATRKGTGAAVGDTITFTYNVLTGATTLVGTGAYSGLK